MGVVDKMLLNESRGRVPVGLHPGIPLLLQDTKAVPFLFQRKHWERALLSLVGLPLQPVLVVRVHVLPEFGLVRKEHVACGDSAPQNHRIMFEEDLLHHLTGKSQLGVK